MATSLSSSLAGTDPADLDLVPGTERRAFNAWPAQRVEARGGWEFRLSGGFTKRANSANAVAPGVSFTGIRAAAEAFYAERGQAAIFRLSPLAPPEADAELAAAGYRLFDPSLVLSRQILPPAAEHPAVEITSTPSAAWLDGFAAANGVAGRHHALHHAMVAAIAAPAAFATLHEAGHAIGFGLAVAEDGAVGFYDIVIAPERRGRGHGRALMGALLDWGRRAGAHWAYLQVRGENQAALRLYASLGFTELYRYHYRVPAALG